VLDAGTPRILLRSLYADQGILQMDVRRLDEAGLKLVCARIIDALKAPRGANTRPPAPADQAAEAVLGWLAERRDA
jgi:hypothetical protein